MRRLLRPPRLMVLLALLVAAAALWVYRTTGLPPQPSPLPVAAQDWEVAWLSDATATAAWQRFVQAIEEVARIEIHRESAFPRLSTAIPEVALPLKGHPGKLRIRWYKRTSEWTTAYWMDALVRRNPPPLAIIGGNTTERATEQANHLRDAAERLDEPHRPLLLLTTATADRIVNEKVPPAVRAAEPSTADDDTFPLIRVYPGRTFRFSFTNTQMGDAVLGFIWSQPELRPDSFPVYAAVWDDDPYSRDLTRTFLASLRPFLNQSEAAALASDLGLAMGHAATGGFPLGPLTIENVRVREGRNPLHNYIPSSVGGFERPNLYEAEVARDILDAQVQHFRQRRALLLLSGQSGPSRRLIRAMCRLSPMRTRRFVLAAGDTIAFNTVLRDRNVTWPVQDLPCSLVFFCHHNPLSGPGKPELGQSEDISGSEDLSLYKDIVRALIQSGKPATADELHNSLGNLRLPEEPSVRFFETGNRRSGSGEHVVWLRPRFDAERALPEATLSVAWQPRRRTWQQRGEPLRVRYTGATDQ